MAPIIGNIIMAVGTTAIMMTKPIQTVIDSGSKAVTGTLDLAGETVSSVHKTVHTANQSIHRAADQRELRARTELQLSNLKLDIRKREGIAEYGEALERLKERYTKLDTETLEKLGKVESLFPQGD